ncbi:MAG TPA: hypothetical protein VL486_10345 [Verrucomicrobiae bacterium]|nr:hypothetical protein [Verrucomicrobiae bacterium]
MTANQKQASSSTPSGRGWAWGRAAIGLWIVLGAALLYVAYLGAHWLPLGMSDKELAASASRVWDIKREIVQHHYLPWWTPYYMSGSSYGLNHARGFYLVPWIFFSTFTDLMTAGKLTALAAILASAVTMYFCARHFLKNEWAAVLAALAFMLHPEQIIRAAGAEHITISLFFPFIPLLWLTLARALESNRFGDTFVCAVVAVLAWWTDNKQAFIHFLFLFGYALYWLWPRRKYWEPTARTCGLLAAFGLALGAWVIAPGVVESKDVKLFIGDPLTDWQRTYSFKSLLGVVDRNGWATSHAVSAVFAWIQANGGRAGTQTEFARVQRVLSLRIDSPEKYMGLVLLVVIAVTILWNKRRVDRRAFWFFVAASLASVMFATGLDNVWDANWETGQALVWQGQTGVEIVGLLACATFLVLFYRRKLTTPRKKFIAGLALALFLFLPGFRLLAVLPYFKDIRAPFVFYDGPGVFWGGMLIGFFVTDVLVAEKWRAHTRKIVGVIAVLLLLDYWPYQEPMKDNGVPAHTLQNLPATYRALEQDTDWVKTYALSGRYFHLLGPMWGGKPQVYEAFYNWMCPLGTGLLNQQALSSWDNHRSFLNLLAARYVVFDKSDPGNAQQGLQQVLAAYRQTFPVVTENEDFVVFRNPSARPYVTGYARACLYDGDIRNSPGLALALAVRDWPLVHGTASPDALLKYETIYRDGNAPPPLRFGETVSLADVRLVRENNELIHIHLTSSRDCLAVISESYYPFWRAELDGRPTNVLRVSCAVMGIELPAGPHEIVLRYQPPRLYAVAGVVSLVALVGGIGYALRNRRSSPR